MHVDATLPKILNHSGDWKTTHHLRFECPSVKDVAAAGCYNSASQQWSAVATVKAIAKITTAIATVNSDSKGIRHAPRLGRS